MKKCLCSICHHRLPKEKFYPEKKRAGGVSSRCIHCQKNYDKKRFWGGRQAYFEKYRVNNIEKVRAKWKAQYALKIGKLIKKPCEVCGKKKTEMHHPDYGHPLKVRWLCHKHHIQLESGSLGERGIYL